MPKFAPQDLWFYAGVIIMAASSLLFVVQAAVYIVRRQRISRKLDEEYGQPQKYNLKNEGNQLWP